jgi:hypothetical protein
MAGSATDFTEKKLADLLFGGTAFTAITPLFFGLLTDSNTATQRDAATVTEMTTTSWTNYARVSVTNNTTNFPAASGITAAKSNGTAISFGTATVISTAPVATAVGVWDASTAGNLLYWADLGASQTISNGNSVSFSAGAFALTVD